MPRADLRAMLLLACSLAGCGGEPPATTATAAAQPDAAALLAESASLELAGDNAGALARAEAALAAGGGRDAAITVAKLAIVLAQFDRAEAVLLPLVEANASDAVAQYDLGLVHHRRDQFNDARTRYIAALKADPAHADARFNLAVLCRDQGVMDEAAHHAKRFSERFPEDPRGAQLAASLVRPASGSARP